ncbi:MAG: hypothetical protein V8R46_03860 [Eubacterium ramulus]
MTILERWRLSKQNGQRQRSVPVLMRPKFLVGEGAIQTIQKMSNMASRLYGGTPNIQIDFEKMQVDRVLQDGDTISLGRSRFVYWRHRDIQIAV